MKKIKLKRAICSSVAAVSLMSALSAVPANAASIYAFAYAASDGAMAISEVDVGETARAEAMMEGLNWAASDWDGPKPGRAEVAISASTYESGPATYSIAIAKRNGSIVLKREYTEP